MKRKYRVKKTANNLYSRLTGREAIQLTGNSDCLVQKYTKIKGGIPIERYAYTQYKGQIPKTVHVSQICGVKQCVKQEHLRASYHPTKEDEQYIKNYIKIDGPEVLAERLGVPFKIFEEYISYQF